MIGRRFLPAALLVLLAACSSSSDDEPARPQVQTYDVPAGSHPHDVAVGPDGEVWYTAQATGKLGRLDPRSGAVVETALGEGSAPHGVIVGPDGAPWVTDGGLNAIARVDPSNREVEIFPMPEGRPKLGMHTAAFDQAGTLWFTGNAGFYGRLFPADGRIEVFDAPGGGGPYGITVTPDGVVWYASLAGSHLARVDPTTGAATVLQPPTPGQGTRRVWTDSKGRVWCSQWNVGQVAVYDPAAGTWKEWRLPGSSPQAYAVYVDTHDKVWLTDFGANAIVRFDPETERFTSFPLPDRPGEVRQLLGRPGEVWGAESGNDKLVVVRD